MPSAEKQKMDRLARAREQCWCDLWWPGTGDRCELISDTFGSTGRGECPLLFKILKYHSSHLSPLVFTWAEGPVLLQRPKEPSIAPSMELPYISILRCSEHSLYWVSKVYTLLAPRLLVSSRLPPFNAPWLGATVRETDVSKQLRGIVLGPLHLALLLQFLRWSPPASKPEAPLTGDLRGHTPQGKCNMLRGPELGSARMFSSCIIAVVLCFLLLQPSPNWHVP